LLTYTQGAEELALYYSNPEEGNNVEEMRAVISCYCLSNPGEPVCSLKSLIHETIAERAAVRVFPHFPFFFETEVGRSRYDWGTYSPPAAHLRDLSEPHMGVPYRERIRNYTEGMLMWSHSPVGYDHHCPGYEKILTKGLEGIIDEADNRARGPLTEGERAFLVSVVRSDRAVIKLADRFAAEAEKVLANLKETGGLDAEAESNLKRIAAAAGRVPAKPAGSFYEALACILFIRENIGSLESFGVSTFGHLDRMLYPYYERDLAAGKITYEEAKGLIHALLSFTDAKFGINDGAYRETSTTVVIGGCDAGGTPVFNAVTRMVVEACMENGYIGTKIIGRISSKHPEGYYGLLGGFAASRANVLAMPNDDVLTAANRRWNKALGDCRLYANGGCHEMVLAGTEVNTRADTYLNLPGVLARSFFYDAKTPIFEEFNAEDGSTGFGGFYRVCMHNVRALHDEVAAAKESYERMWRDFDAAPFYSSTLADCVENAKDLTAGGARYNSVSLSMVGAATFIDSLFVFKKLVFDEKTITAADFRKAMAENYEGREDLAAYVKNRIPRHGQDDAEYNGFARGVMHDLSRMGGQPNGRGGVVTPAFYPHDLYRGFGMGTAATPDGRRAGEFLSRGFAPGESTPIKNVTDIINSIKSFDLTLFPESFATEITLPATVGSAYRASEIASFIKVFAQSGGSTLQINVLDREELIRARAEPEKHPNLVVRVCGYSQTFNSLTDEQKDEIIERTARFQG